MGRKDLSLKKVDELKGKKVANQTGSSTGNIFTDQIAPAAGLKKGDFQEVRMNINDMVAAMVAKTVDAMVTVEPYNAIAEADGIANTIMDFCSVDKLPVFMAATPEFVEKNPDTVVAYLKAWLDGRQGIQGEPRQGRRGDLRVLHLQGLQDARDTFKALARVEVDPGFPTDLKPYMQHHAEILLKEKKITAIPDWKKALRPEFMEKARGGDALRLQ